MSDVVAVAIITALATVPGTIAAYRVGKRSTEVELAKVDAEAERLREQHREDDRRTRRDLYHQALANLIRTDAVGVGYGSDEEFRRLLSEDYPALLAELRVSGSPEVAKAMEDVAEVFQEIGAETGGGGQGTAVQRFRRAYRPRRDRMLLARRQLVDAMRRDLGSSTE